MRGHRRPPVGEHELGAVADHAAPLEVLARVEARRVDQREDRQVEGVAERHEAGGLLRRRDVQRAGQRQRLVGDDADRAPTDRGERGHHVGGPAGADLQHAVGIDDRRGDLADVVAPGRDGWDQLAGLRAAAVDGVVGGPVRRLAVDAVWQVREEVRHRVERGVPCRHDQRGHAGVAGQLSGPTQLVRRHADARELLDHHRPVDEPVAGLPSSRRGRRPRAGGPGRTPPDRRPRRSSAPRRSSRRAPWRGCPSLPARRCPRGCPSRSTPSGSRGAGARRGRCERRRLPPRRSSTTAARRGTRMRSRRQTRPTRRAGVRRCRRARGPRR